MGFWDKFTRSPQEQPKPVTVEIDMRSSSEKIAYHIRRFTLAIEQCEKGPSRVAELQANLDYWLSMRELETVRGGLI